MQNTQAYTLQRESVVSHSCQQIFPKRFMCSPKILFWEESDSAQRNKSCDTFLSAAASRDSPVESCTCRLIVIVGPPPTPVIFPRLRPHLKHLEEELRAVIFQNMSCTRLASALECLALRSLCDMGCAGFRSGNAYLCKWLRLCL